MAAQGRPGGRTETQSISGLDLDKVIHERARLMVLTYLASSQAAEIGFTELRDSLGFTAGNLSIQLRTLEEAGYVRTDKRFVSRKSFTGVSLTKTGQDALSAYLAELEVIVASLKTSRGGPGSRGKPADAGAEEEVVDGGSAS